MDHDDGLVAAFALDGRGGGLALTWEGLSSRQDGVVWAHLDYRHQRVRSFVREDPRVPPTLHEALFDPDPRPRSETVDDHLFVVLRGVNVNEGAEPEDMVALRLLLAPDFVVTLRHRRLASVREVAEEVAHGRGPRDAPRLLCAVVDRLLERVVVLVERLDDESCALEELLLSGPSPDLRPRLASLRRRAIALRRHLLPQRDALARLAQERVAWLDDEARAALRQDAERLSRVLEDLEAARERAAVSQEELGQRQAERLGRTMYLLSVLSAIFLPLTFLTGLLGVNVGGIPGASTPFGFPVVAGVLTALALLELWLLRRGRWL